MTKLDDLINIDFENKTELIREARRGISPIIFVRFAKEIGCKESSLGKLINISANKIHKYIADKKPLGPVQSEHMLKLIFAYKLGETILGTVSDFEKWLQLSSGFGKESYFQLLNTPGSIDIVCEEMTRIAEGYPV